MTRCVPPTGRRCHRPAGLRMLIPSLASIYCRCPGSPQAQGLVSPVRDPVLTGEHSLFPRSQAQASWRLLCFGHQALTAAQAPGLQRELRRHLWPQVPTSPGLPATGGSVKDTFLVWQPLESYHCAPQKPPHPFLPTCGRVCSPRSPATAQNLHTPAFPTCHAH